MRLFTLLAAGLLTACSASDEGGESNNSDKEASRQEIRLEADVWRMMEGTGASGSATSASGSATNARGSATRAVTYNNASDLQSAGSFTCYAYNAGTTTAYINGATVLWDSGTSRWYFSGGSRYWSTTSNLDFFAVMGGGGAASIEYNSRSPRVTCTNLPNSASGQGSETELIYALTTGRNKTNAAAGVSLTFLHPFARVYFQRGTIPSTVTLNSIILGNIKNNGTYTHGGSWTPSGDDTNFTSGAFGGPYLVVPQDFSGTIEVSATWDEWGVSTPHNLVASVPTTWKPGYSYTYTFSIKGNDLIVETDKFTEQW